MALNTRLSVSLASELTATPDLGSSTTTTRLARELVLLSGTGADQADRIWADSGSIDASTTTTLDLAGALTQPDGSALALAKVKAVIVRNTHATQTLTVQRPAANGVPLLTAAGDAIPVPAGGLLVLAAPAAAGLAAVTAGTGDLLDLVNGAGSAVTYEIAIIGTSA